MLMMQWWADYSPNAICQLDLGFNTASHIHMLCLHALSTVCPADSLQTLLACFNWMVYFVVHYSLSVKGFYLQCYSWSASVLLWELSRMRQTVAKKSFRSLKRSVGSYCLYSQDLFPSSVPEAQTEEEKQAFKYNASSAWNQVESQLNVIKMCMGK